jgi:hypothetical protein
MTRTAAALLLLALAACAPDDATTGSADAGLDAPPAPEEGPRLWPGDVEPGVGPECAAPAGCEQDRECAWCLRDEFNAAGLRRMEGEACLWEVQYATASDLAQEWWDWCEFVRNPPP